MIAFLIGNKMYYFMIDSYALYASAGVPVNLISPWSSHAAWSHKSRTIFLL